MSLLSPLPPPQTPFSSLSNEHGAGHPNGRSGEAWRECDTVALEWAQLHFPEHAARLLQAMALALRAVLSQRLRKGAERQQFSGVAALPQDAQAGSSSSPGHHSPQGSNQIKLFPLLPGLVFPCCCSALEVCLALDVPTPCWGNYCCFPPHQDFTDSRVQISRSWYKAVHFQRLFNRWSTCRRHLKEYSSAKLRLYNKQNWDLLKCHSCFLPTAHTVTTLADSSLVYLHILCWFHFFFLLLLLPSVLSPCSKRTHKNPVSL